MRYFVLTTFVFLYSASQLGTTVTNSNCTEVFLCKPGGEVETTSISCAENAACTLGDDGKYSSRIPQIILHIMYAGDSYSIALSH